MPEYHQPLFPCEKYHLFSRAVGNEKLFLEPRNYVYFLDKLFFHTVGVADIFTYSLLPNHFHLVVRIKDEETIIDHFETVKKKTFDQSIHNLPDFIMERFSNFLNCYTKSFKNMYWRKGALFMDYLRRNKVEEDVDFSNFILYTHKNAVHHGYTRKIGKWEYDGYHLLVGNEPTNLLRSEVLDWFGGKDKFIAFHDRAVEIKKTVFLSGKYL